MKLLSTNQFKNGNHIEVDGTIYKIVEFQHVKPGKGGAFVRTKLKSLNGGVVVAALLVAVIGHFTADRRTGATRRL